MASEDDDCCVRLRGIPFDCNKNDIAKFFSGLEIVPRGIIIACNKVGRRTGEAYVRFKNKEMADKALDKDRQSLGRRYIEIFKSSLKEMRSVTDDRDNDDGCVRLRGLPFDCTEEDIVEFFGELEVLPQGITLVKNHLGRSTGEAYVQFVTKEMADEALDKNLQNMGHRYIEIFRCSVQELHSARVGNRKPWGPKGNDFNFLSHYLIKTIYTQVQKAQHVKIWSNLNIYNFSIFSPIFMFSPKCR